jgi:hypothetical protein
MTEKYLMKELMFIFSTQTDINKLVFRPKSGVPLISKKSVKDTTSDAIYEDFKQVDTISKE